MKASKKRGVQTKKEGKYIRVKASKKKPEEKEEDKKTEEKKTSEVD